MSKISTGNQQTTIIKFPLKGTLRSAGGDKTITLTGMLGEEGGVPYYSCQDQPASISALELPITAALFYASLGWPVFPLHTLSKSGGCSCGKGACSSPAKHPRTTAGFKDATIEAETILAWWRKWPSANIGIATGADAGIFVLDVDQKNGGFKALEELESKHGILPETANQRTGGSGRHYLFRFEAGIGTSSGQLPAGLDVRGEGGYIVAAPSIHVSGNAYSWIDRDLIMTPAKAPSWLLKLIAMKKRQASNERPASSTIPGSSAYGQKALDGERAKLQAATNGNRNTLLNAAAFSLGQLIAGGELMETVVIDELTTSARFLGLGDHEIERTIKSGLEAGKRDPRTAPEKPAIKSAAASLDQEKGRPPASPPAIVTHNEVLRRVLASLQPLKYSEFERYAVERYGFTEGDELRQKHWVVLAVDLLLKAITDHGYHLAKSGDFIFVFNGAYWRECDRETFANFLGQAAAKLGVKAIEVAHHRYRGELYAQFMARAYFEEIEQDGDTVLINLQNGTFEIDRHGQRLREFRAGDFLKHQLSFAFVPAASAPMFEKYLKKVLPEDELQDIVAEFFGYVFTRGMKLEKALLLYGLGANGKSVLFDVMNALLGRQNITNFSLSDLDEEHNRALIANKLLNYGSEINAGITRDKFKNLVSGEPIMARLKYGNSFVMERYAKLAFNCNELPRDIEHSEAYFRRLLIIPFDVRIPDDQQDKDLAKKIIETELAGVFNWVLSGLRRLLANRNFTKSDIVKLKVEEYRRESDSVQSFIVENEGRELGLLKPVYSNYREHCLEAGYKPLGRNNFAKRMRALGYAVEKAGPGMEITKQ